MSRRKQHTPRHLDSDEGGELISKPLVPSDSPAASPAGSPDGERAGSPASPETAEPRSTDTPPMSNGFSSYNERSASSSSTIGPDEVMSESTNDVTAQAKSPAPTRDPAVDDDCFVCPVCNMDFLERSDLVAHKKMCTAAMAAVTRKRNFDYDEEDKENLLTEPPNKKKLVNGVLSDDETEQFDGMDAPSDGEESMRHVRQASSLLGKYGNSDRMSTVGDSRRGSTSDRRSDSSEMISPVDDTMGDGEGKDSHSSAITQQMAMFSDSNVKLERLDSTKVAVAQIAENNNFAPNEIAMLLYSLHQQQLLQLQLLQQLQSQIASGVTPSIQNLPAMLVPGATALLAPMAGINSPMMGSMAPTHLVSPPTSAVASSQSTTSAPTTASLQHAICSAATNTKSSVITTASSAPSDQTTTKSTDHYHSHATNNHHHGNSSRNNSATTGQQHQSERQRHRHNDEQEQGQEHERSYTCNVCNNRFPSRGSLKLHMARHHDHYGHNQSSSSHHISSSESRDRHINSNASSSSSSGDAANTSPIMIAPLASTDGNDHHRSKERRGEEDHPQHAVGDAENRSAGTSLPNGETSPTNVAEGSGQTSPTAEDSANGEPGNNQGQHLVFPPFSKEQPPPLINSHGPPGHHPGGPLGLIPPPMGMLGPMPPMPMPGAPPLPPFGYENPFVRKSILPSQHEDDSMEEFMEIDKSETSKLQALVENLDKKLTDPNECAICNRILSCKSALQMHYRTHTGERPFKCKICGRAFTTKGNLKTHMGVHRSKPPMRMLHQCPVCHKQFTNALVLQQHIRMHTGEIPKEMQMPTDFAGPSPGAPGYMPGFHGFPFLPPPMGFVPPGLRPPLMPGMEPDMRNHKISPYTPRKEDTKENNSDKYSDREDYNDRERDGYDERNSRDENETKNDRDDYDARPYPSHMSDMIDRDMQEAASVASEKASRSSHHNDHESGDVSGDENNYERSAMSPVSDRPASPYDKSTTSEYSKRDDDKYCTDNYQQSASSAEGSTSQTGTPRYSSSLIALEERVNSIDTTSPLTQYGMHRASEHEMLSAGNHSNRSSSPTTPENGGKGSSPAGVSSSSFPITPTLSSSPNFGLPEMFSARPPGFNGFGAPEVSPKSFNSPRSTTCNICFKTFACRSALDIHYRSHTKERPFKCEICDRGFSTRGNMRQHMLTHKNRDNSEKNDGSLETIQEQNSPQGESQHDSSDVPTGDSRPTSPYNSQTSVNSPGVVSSPSKQQQQYDDEPLAHNRPPSPPYNPNNHRQHNSSSTSPHVTDSNAESTKTAASNAGNDSKSQSSASTTPQHGMDYGRRTQNNMKHVCRVCQKPFSSASALQIHMRTHTGDKPFKCTVCGKAFTTRGNLKVHMGTHMWNNAPSRRGRRMSIDTMPQLPPFPNNQPKDGGDYYNFPHHRELFPFPPFQGFGLPNGLSPKMNEISVIQGLNGNMPHMLPMLDNMMPGHPLMKTGMKDLPPWKQDSRQDEKVSEQNNNKTSSGLISMGGSGELDLSLRKSASDVKSPGGSTPAVSQPLPPSSTHHSQLSPSHHSPGRTSSSTSDSRHQSSPASLMQSPPPSSVSLNSSWMWKTTCHLCNQILPNVHALEVHMQNHVTRQEASSPKPVIA